MEETRLNELSSSKLIALITVLYSIYMGVSYFYSFYFIGDLMYLLYGIIIIVFIVLIFFSLNLINLGIIKIPFKWWLMLTFGVILIPIAYFSTGYYFPSFLAIISSILDKRSLKKHNETPKWVAFVGLILVVYESIALILLPSIIQHPEYGNNIVCGIFGLILSTYLFMVISDTINLKVSNYSRWKVFIIGFVFYSWISPFSISAGYMFLGFGGPILLISFILTLIER